MEKICAVVVTYNRLDCLKQALKALEQQSFPLSGILVFDNHSSDNTIDYLKNQGYSEIKGGQEKHISRSYFCSESNLGGSGGFSNAVKIASKGDFDYLWIMDDDVAPVENCLSLLLNSMQMNKVQVGIPARIGENFTDKVCVDLDMANFFKFFIWWRKKYAKHPLKRDTYLVQDMTFEGPLINTSVIKKAGMPDSSYFIQFDDTDYAQRLLHYSKILYVKDAVLERQLPAKVIKKDEKKEPMNWKDYYFIRNNIAFDKRYGKRSSVRILSPVLMIIYYLLLSVKDGNLKVNFPILMKAAYHGMNGKMGKRVDPNY